MYLIAFLIMDVVSKVYIVIAGHVPEASLPVYVKVEIDERFEQYDKLLLENWQVHFVSYKVLNSSNSKYLEQCQKLKLWFKNVNNTEERHEIIEKLY